MTRTALLLAACLTTMPVAAMAADTLAQVRSSGVLTCGVNTEETDFSKFEEHGDLSVLGRDVCRAVAAAVLGDSGKVALTAFSDDPSSLAGLSTGKVALLVGATPDPENEAAFGLGFGPPVFFDGQGFLVHQQTGPASMKDPASLKDLADRPVCFISETKAQQDLTDQLALQGVRFMPFPFEETGEMEAALVTGHCAAIAAPVSELADMRTGFHARTVQYVILPQTITLEPVDPVYRLDDPHWARIIDWTVHALVLAEQEGVTQANAAAMRTSGRPEVQYLLGGSAGVGKTLGLDDAWALRAIRAVGNYGEMFERDVGSGSPLHLPRGRNALWTQGGMMYSPPLR